MKTFLKILVTTSLVSLSLVAAAKTNKTSSDADNEITPVQSSTSNPNEISTKNSGNASSQPLKVKVSDQPPVVIQSPGKDHQPKIGNPAANSPGTLKGNEPSMQPVIETEVEFEEPTKTNP
jgi:hypothetical protein